MELFSHNWIQNISVMPNRRQVAYVADLIHREEYDQAIYYIHKILSQEDAGTMQQSVLYYDLGLANFYQGNFGQAKDVLKTVTEELKGFPDAYYLLGIVCSTVYDEYDEAIEAYSVALDSEGVDRVDCLLARADAYEKNGSFDEARKDYQAVLQLEPDNQFALNGLKRV